MSVTSQKHLGNVEPHLYHHGLVKILIEKQLKEKRDTWEQFLIRNFFEEPQETPEGSTSKRSRRKRTSDKTQSTPTNTVERTSREERLYKRRKGKTEGKKPTKSKEKIIIEAVHQTPSSEEDHQVLSERLVHLEEQSAMAKKKGKEKQKEEDNSPKYVRRSSRLKGKWRKAQTKGPHFIDLGGGTPKQTLAG